MKIQIISIGKISGNQLEIMKHYQKMINWKINNIELTCTQKLSENQIKRHEAKLIKEKILPNSCMVVLDVLGKQISSEDFSNFISGQMNNSQDIDFIIGGAFGLDDSILSMTNRKLSLSKMTFPHQIAKLLLFEQIYRAQTILEGHPYHK